MIPVQNPIPEPDNFDTKCRIPGNQWLADHPAEEAGKYPGRWREFQGELAIGFTYRCGWSAMHIGSDGAVDHYLSKENYRDKVYEWGNYRYVSTTVNSSKQTLDEQVLDPFEVEEGWFEVRIPSFILVTTDAVPPAFREKAEFTVKRLQLDQRRKFVENRRQWYRDHCNGLPIEHLERYAPLVASAVRTWEATGRTLPKC